MRADDKGILKPCPEPRSMDFGKESAWGIAIPFAILIGAGFLVGLFVGAVLWFF